MENRRTDEHRIIRSVVFLRRRFGSLFCFLSINIKEKKECVNAERKWVLGRHKKNQKNSPRPSIQEIRKAFVCTMDGTRELQIENYGSLGDYSEEKIELQCYKCKMVIEGEGLLIEYFTDIDMRITGKIHAIYFQR